jgi:uncharacterized protein (TIGR02231 family)
VSELPSTPVQVTLFEDRAEVVRRARAQVPPGVSWVTLSGATPYLDDRSIRAKVTGAQVLAARVRRRVIDHAHAAPEALAKLEEEERAARAASWTASWAREGAETDARRTAQLATDFAAALAQVPRHASDAERLKSWREAYQALDRAAGDAHAALARARAEEQRASEACDRAAIRLAEGQRREIRWQALLEVQVEAAAAGEVEVEVAYRTPCALWRPEHLARLSIASGKLELVTSAVAWQATGEAWDHVELKLSTARTARASSPPLLSDDLLRARDKSREEKKRVVVQARDQTVELAGAEGGSAVDDMPGVDDGGEPLWFAPSGRVSLASDGRPFRVEIARVTVPVELTLMVMPERAQAAHLRARATLSGKTPLLAGPVVLLRDHSFAGRGRTGFVAPGEPFVIGFGSDDGLRVRREVHEDRESIGITNTQKRRHEVELFLSNLSSAPRKLEVTERIPVSEIEDLEIKSDAPGWTVDADGFARRTVEVKPGEHLKLELAWELRAGSNVTLPY